ncbi:MAG: DHA2 family efflux MFS transporter permease subunit, partial [Chloroflexi bacterium]|nr:DHA2 family efflux MFS transporter permease subunit [Chloroflexota bacterium]
MNVNAALSKRSDYKWWIFGSVAIGMFISVMDQTGVNLALPRIADHFDATIPEVQWVALGYILTTGSLMLPMGRLADMIGPKRVYTTGFVIFVVAAVLTGLAPTLLTVILFKVLQGVGAAMAQATGMAIVTSAFPNEERGKAIGMFMTIVGSGAIVGPMVGGAIVGEFGWRYIFFMGVPLGIVSVIAATLVLPRAQARPASSRRLGFDWPGAVLSAGALAVFLVVMTTGYRVGWATPLVWVAFAGAVALLAAFIWWERRTSDPMLALELFRNRLFSTGIAANFLTFLGVTSIFFLMPFYLQEVLEFTPGQAGLIMAPTALIFALLGPIIGRLSDRYGTRKFT